MATIYNSDLSKELQNGARLQIRDKCPTELAEKVVPVMEVNPKALRAITFVIDYSRSTTASGVTIFTTDANKRTFIKGISINNVSDAAADNTAILINSKIFGDSTSGTNILRLNKITLTAGSFEKVNLFDGQGVELQRNTTVTLSNVFTVGVSTTGVTIWGYTVDNANA